MRKSQKTTTTVTTTTIMSRRQRVYRFMEDGLAWYSERRRRSPCLWTWIPLLLLLLALLLLIPWLVSLSGRNGSSSSSSSSKLSSTWHSSSFLSSAVDWLRFGAAFVYQTAISVCTIMLDWLVSFLIFMKDLFINLVFGVRFVLGYIWTVSASYLSYISNLVSGSSSQEGKVSVYDSQHWARAYSPLPVLYSGYAIALDGVKYVSSSSWVLIMEAASYMGSGLAFVGNAVASSFITILHLITSAFSSLWLLAVYLLNGLGGMFSKFNFSPSKYESAPVPFAKPPSSFHDSSKLSSEELVTKVLASPQLQSFIALNLKENLNVDTNEALKESLSSVVKLNVETEMNRMKSDILASQSASEGAFFAAKEEDIRSLRNQQQDLIGQLRGMEAILAKIMTSQQVGAEDTTKSKEHLEKMMAEISASIEKLSDQYGYLQSDHENLVKKVTSCCQNRSLTLEQVEDHILVLLSDLVGLSPDGESEGDRASKLQLWFQSYFAAKEELDGKLNVLWEKGLSDSTKDASPKDVKGEDETLKQTADLVMGVVLEQMRTEIKAQHDESLEVMRQIVEEKTKHVAGIALSGQGNVVAGLNTSAIRQIVKDALLKYDADKTGMVDHALESGGGSIVSTRCTEGFQGHQVELTMFGYSFYRYSTNTPRSLIQPDRNPGQCYAFKGSQGFVVIQFVGPVRMTGFTLEHIPKVLTPSGSIDSALKEFSVYGLQTTEEEGFHFGNFVYSDEGEPLQYFPVHNKSEEFFKFVELKIHSNHGNIQYTCVYRFRVHGVRQY